MLDIEQIRDTITELENGSTSFDNCLKLASLYIVSENYNRGQNASDNAVERELTDILPQYKKYVAVKREYELGNTGEKLVKNAIHILCNEIYEFLHTLYSCTDLQEERDAIHNLIQDLQKVGS